MAFSRERCRGRASPPPLAPPSQGGEGLGIITPPLDGAKNNTRMATDSPIESTRLFNIQQPLRTGVALFPLFYQYPVKGSHVQWISRDLVILCDATNTPLSSAALCQPSATQPHAASAVGYVIAKQCRSTDCGSRMALSARRKTWHYMALLTGASRANPLPDLRRLPSPAMVGAFRKCRPPAYHFRRKSRHSAQNAFSTTARRIQAGRCGDWMSSKKVAVSGSFWQLFRVSPMSCRRVSAAPVRKRALLLMGGGISGT